MSNSPETNSADERAGFDLKLAQLFFGFIAISGLIAMLIFGAQLTKYAPEGPAERSVNSEVTEVNYGTSSSKMSPELPKERQGKSCFLKVEDWPETFEASAVDCDFEAGNDIEILVDDSEGTARIAPRHFNASIFTLELLLILGGSLLAGGAFGVGVIAWRRASLRTQAETQREAEDELQLR